MFMSDEQMDATTAVKEFLTCLEVLMEEVDFHQDLQEWFAIADEIRHRITEPKAPSKEELDTAMWQTVELGMALLEDHLTMVQFMEQLEATVTGQDDKNKVGEIIRPHLIVPQ